MWSPTRGAARAEYEKGGKNCQLGQARYWIREELIKAPAGVLNVQESKPCWKVVNMRGRQASIMATPTTPTSALLAHTPHRPTSVAPHRRPAPTFLASIRDTPLLCALPQSWPPMAGAAARHPLAV